MEQQIIPYNDLLHLLEGQPVHLPAPKSHYSHDILLEHGTPIFCTSSQNLRFVKNGVLIERETQMMGVRCKVFKFTFQIAEEDQEEVKPCMRCFADLLCNNWGF